MCRRLLYSHNSILSQFQSVTKISECHITVMCKYIIRFEVYIRWIIAWILHFFWYKIFSMPSFTSSPYSLVKLIYFVNENMDERRRNEAKISNIHQKIPKRKKECLACFLLMYDARKTVINIQNRVYWVLRAKATTNEQTSQWQHFFNEDCFCFW